MNSQDVQLKNYAVRSSTGTLLGYVDIEVRVGRELRVSSPQSPKQGSTTKCAPFSEVFAVGTHFNGATLAATGTISSVSAQAVRIKPANGRIRRIGLDLFLTESTVLDTLLSLK